MSTVIPLNTTPLLHRERTGEIFTRVEFDREEKQAYALEVEARDGAASARPNANGRPNTGKLQILICWVCGWES